MTNCPPVDASSVARHALDQSRLCRHAPVGPLHCPRIVLYKTADPSFTIPVRWQGRLLNIRTYKSAGSNSLTELILQALSQDHSEPLQPTNTLVSFYGRAPSGSQSFRKLLEHEIPRDWNALERFKHLGGFVEVLVRLKGGADSGQPQTPDYHPPNYNDVPDWSLVDAALLNEASGSAVTNSTSPNDAAKLAKYLHRYVGVGGLPQLANWPAEYHEISAARVVALGDLVVRGLVPPRQLPSWHVGSQWMHVRLNSLNAVTLGLASPATGTSSSSRSLAPALLALLVDRIPYFCRIRIDPVHQETWAILEANVTAHYNHSTSRFLAATMLLPPDDPTGWRSSLLLDAPSILGGAYITPHPSRTFIEAELRPRDSAIILHLAANLKLGHDVFMRSLDLAFSRAWDRAFVSCRYGCELRNQNQRPTLVDPQSSRSSIVVGADITTWLRVNRALPLTTLRLGSPDQSPVSFVIQTPTTPPPALWAIIDETKPAAREFALDGVTNPGLTHTALVICPLPKSWIPKSVRSDKIEQIRHIQQSQVAIGQVIPGARFIARAGEAPFALYLMFPSVECATEFAIRVVTDSSVYGVFEQVFGSKPKTAFEVKIPPECIALLGEKGLRKFVLTPPDPGGPTSHAAA